MADDDAQWRRPVVQPQDVVAMLANPLSAPRVSSGGYAPSSSAPPRRVLKPASNGAKPARPPQSSYANKNPLLTKRVYQVAEYHEDFYRPPRGPKGATDGGPAPIPVPLLYGEKFREYEDKFVAWLHKKKVTLQDLRGNAQRERGYRISFANLRVLGDDPKKPSRSQQASKVVGSQDAPPRPRKRAIVRIGDNGDGDDDDDYGNYDGKYIGGDGPPRKVHIKNEMPSLALLAEPRYTPSPPAADALLLPRSGAKVPSQPAASHSHSLPQPVPSSAAVNSSNQIFTQQCRATLPGPKAPHAAFSAAYVKCCCQQCLRDWNIMLTERLDALENEVRVLRKTQQTAPPCTDHRDANGTQQRDAASDKATAASDYDTSLKKEVKSEDSSGNMAPESSESKQEHRKDHSATSDVAVNNSETSSADPVGEPEPVNEDKSDADGANSAVVSDANSSSQSGEDQSQLATVSETPAPPTSVETAEVPASSGSIDSGSSSNVVKPFPPSWPQRDPIQAQMLHEYNTLNDEILLNEQVVEASLQRVQTTMMTDMASAMQELEQIEQIKTSIQSEMANRDAALAVFVAYTWRSHSQELEARAQQYGTLHLAHVHRASHAKCAMLASQLEDKLACVVRVKATLDALLTSSGGGGALAAAAESIDELSALGTELVQTEQDVVALEREQMDEFMRLFQFSHDIRKLCKSMAMTKPASA